MFLKLMLGYFDHNNDEQLNKINNTQLYNCRDHGHRLRIDVITFILFYVVCMQPK